MEVNNYIQENYYQLKNKMFNITRGENKDLFEDCFHDVLTIFLQHHKASEVVANGKAQFFIARIFLNQWRSSSSDFHLTYRLPLMDLTDDTELADTDYDITEDVLIDVLMQSLDEMYKNDDSRYKAMIVILYHSLGNNYSEVERQFNIPRTTVRLHYKEGIALLNDIIKKNLKLLDNGDFRLSEDLNQFVTDWCNNLGTDEQQTVSMASKLFTSKYFSVS